MQGWAAASPVSSRAVYRGVVEHSVYVATAAHGQGIGRALLRALLDATEQAGCWTVQAGIFPENTASLALHEREGFRIVGRREAIALMTTGPHAGEWRDTLLVERRSASGGRVRWAPLGRSLDGCTSRGLGKGSDTPDVEGTAGPR